MAKDIERGSLKWFIAQTDALRSENFFETINYICKELKIPSDGNAALAEAVLIYTVERCYSSSDIRRDIILMSLGLLCGYTRRNSSGAGRVKGITWRRRKFFMESSYLSADEYRQFIEGTGVEEGRNYWRTSVWRKFEGRLRRTENLAWEKVAEKLFELTCNRTEQVNEYAKAAVKAYPSCRNEYIDDQHLPELINVRQDDSQSILQDQPVEEAEEAEDLQSSDIVENGIPDASQEHTELEIPPDAVAEQSPDTPLEQVDLETLPDEAVEQFPDEAVEQISDGVVEQIPNVAEVEVDTNVEQLPETKHPEAPRKRKPYIFPVAVIVVFLVLAVWVISKNGNTMSKDDPVNPTSPSETIIPVDLDNDRLQGPDFGYPPYIGAIKADDFAFESLNVIGDKEINVQSDAIFTVLLRAENTGRNGEKISVAKANFELPDNTPAHRVEVKGRLRSANTYQTENEDAVVFYDDHALFHLEYVEGSARIYNNWFGADGFVLSDAVVGNGVLIGYDKADGIIPCGHEYACFVAIQVRVVYDTEYEVGLRVRLHGDKEWSEFVDANVGDKVEFEIMYRNISTIGEIQENVVLKVVLPETLQYVVGSADTSNTILANANHPVGIGEKGDGTIIGAGINIGTYAAGANAFVLFTAEVVDNGLVSGTTELIVWAQCGVGGKTVQDSAKIYVGK